MLAWFRNDISRLVEAVKEDNTVEVANIITRSGKSVVNKIDEQGYTALMWACARGSLGSCSALIDSGADLNIPNKEGGTALVCAAQSRQFDTLEMVIKAGANVNVVDKKRQTALMWAIQAEDKRCVVALLRAGAHVNVQNEEGATPLLIALHSTHFPSVEPLVAAGADVNVKDNKGDTPLILACGEGHRETVTLLLKSGVQINAQNNEGVNAVMNASQHGYSDCLRLLIDAGADVNMRNKYGLCALVWASANGHGGCVAVLVGAGADLTMETAEGKTAMDWAETKEIKGILKRAKAAAAAAESTKKPTVVQQASPILPVNKNVSAVVETDPTDTTSDISSKSGPNPVNRAVSPIQADPRALEDALSVQEQEDNSVKIVLLGAGRAGKTGLANSLLGKTYTDTASTIGIETFTCDIRSLNVQDQDESDNTGPANWLLGDATMNQLEEKLALAVVDLKRSRALGASLRGKGRVNKIPTVTSSNTGGESLQPQPPASLFRKNRDQSSRTNDNVENDPEGENSAQQSVPVAFDAKNVINSDLFYKILGEAKFQSTKYKIKLYDFGGQDVFYSIHHFFLTKKSLYLITFNMEWLIRGSPAEKEQCLEELKFWINSVVLHTKEVLADGVGTSMSPFALVGTHKDLIADAADHEKISKILYDEFQGNVAWANRIRFQDAQGSRGVVNLNFFPVNNKLSLADPAIRALMQTLETVIDNFQPIHERKPVAWFRFFDSLVGLQCNMVTLESATELGYQCSLSESSMLQALQHYHNLGFLMWHDEEKLRDFIVLEPISFFVKPATVIICKHLQTDEDAVTHVLSVHQTCEREYPALWSQMMTKGIIGEVLLKALLKGYEEHVDLILNLMKRYALIVPFKNTVNDQHQYLAPPLIPTGNVDALDIPALENVFWIHFTLNPSECSDIEYSADLGKKGFFPDGLFDRFIGRIFQWTQQTRSKNTDFAITKEFVILYFGSQKFYVTLVKKINCIRVDVEGASPLLVRDRLVRILQDLTAECMQGLSFILYLPYFGDDSEQRYPKLSTTFPDENTMFVRLEAVEDVTSGATSLISRVSMGRSIQLNRLRVNNLFSVWTTVPRIQNVVDVFISYRWNRKDSEFTSKLYDRLSVDNIEADNYRPFTIFLDTKRLKQGSEFREDIVNSLAKCKVFAPIVSPDAMFRLKTHDPNAIDNLLLEWLCACVLKEVGKIYAIIPIAFGDSSDPKLRVLFMHPILTQLPDIIPTATMNKAHELLSALGVSRLDILQQFTVDSIVNKNIFGKYLAICTWELSDDAIVDSCCGTISKNVNDAIFQLSALELGGHSADPAPTSSTIEPAHVSSTNDQPQTLMEMIKKIKAELDLHTDNVVEVLEAAANLLLSTDEKQEFQMIPERSNKAKYLLKFL